MVISLLFHYRLEQEEEEKEENKPEVDRDIFGVTQCEESDEESDSGSDQEDAAVVDMKRPSDPKPESPLLTDVSTEQEGNSTEQEGNPTDDFLKSNGKFSFGSHDANERDVSDLFIPDEAKMSDDMKLFVSDDDPDLLK